MKIVSKENSRIYFSKDGDIRLQAEVFTPDGSGYFELTKSGIQVVCREDGNIDDWIEDLNFQIEQLQKISNFLNDVRHKEIIKIFNNVNEKVW